MSFEAEATPVRHYWRLVMFKFAMNLLGLLAVIITQIPTEAFAQRTPTAAPYSTVSDVARAPATPGPATTGEPPFVMLADFTPAGQIPRAARPSTIAADTPTITRENFLTTYPQAGAVGYSRIANANRQLCEQCFANMEMILQLDILFERSDNAYDQLMGIYEALPESVRRGSRVMTITQAGATGALCALSLGIYCIAAVFTAIGNLFSNGTNRRLQLANIRLSIQNIIVTRLNITSNRVTLRLDAFWLDLVAPGCIAQFPEMAARFPNGFAASLPPLVIPAAVAFNDNNPIANDNAPLGKPRERRRR